MQPQDISLGVSKNSTGVITVNCDCGDSSHNHTVFVNNDEGIISVDVYTVTYSKFKLTEFHRTDFWNAISNRFKQAFAILFKGYAEYETNLLLDKQSALNYADALIKAVKEEEKNG